MYVYVCVYINTCTYIACMYSYFKYVFELICPYIYIYKCIYACPDEILRVINKYIYIYSRGHYTYTSSSRQVYISTVYCKNQHVTCTLSCEETLRVSQLRTHTYTLKHTHIHTYTCTHVHIHAYTRTSAFATHIRIESHTYARTCLLTYECLSYTYTQMHTHITTHIQLPHHQQRR